MYVLVGYIFTWTQCNWNTQVHKHSKSNLKCFVHSFCVHKILCPFFRLLFCSASIFCSTFSMLIWRAGIVWFWCIYTKLQFDEVSNTHNNRRKKSFISHFQSEAFFSRSLSTYYIHKWENETPFLVEKRQRNDSDYFRLICVWIVYFSIFHSKQKIYK